MTVSPAPFGRLLPMPVIVRPSTFTSASNRSPGFTTVPPRITRPMTSLRIAPGHPPLRRRVLRRHSSPSILHELHPRFFRGGVLVRLEQHVVLVDPRRERGYGPQRVAELDTACGAFAERRLPRRCRGARDPLAP